MNADMIAAGPAENGFLMIGLSKHRRRDDAGVITIGIREAVIAPR